MYVIFKWTIDSYIELDVRHQFSITVHEPDAVPEPEPESEDEESNHEFITGI